MPQVTFKSLIDLRNGVVISIGIYYEVRDGQSRLFEMMYKEVEYKLTKSSGLVRAHLYRRVDDPLSYMVYSEWRTADDFKRFIASDPFKTVTTIASNEILKGKPTQRIFEIID